MLIFEFNIISTHGTSGALRECQLGSPRVAYRRMSNPVHHAQACWLCTCGEKDPLQLAEHSGDAAGVVPAIADIPSRAMLHHHVTMSYLISACCNVCGSPTYIQTLA